MSGIRNSLRIFWNPKSLGNPTSPALSSAAQDSWDKHMQPVSKAQICLAMPSSVLFRHSKFLESSISQGLNCNWGFTFTSSLSYSPFRETDPETQGPVLAALQNTFIPKNQSHVRRLYTLPGSTSTLKCRLDLLRTTAFMCWPWGNNSQKILPQWSWPLTDQLIFQTHLTSFHFPSKVSFHLSCSDHLLITASSSAPAD